MFQINLARTYPYFVVAIICSLLTLWYLITGESPIQESMFAYHHDWFETGQWWRLITAHFMHTNVFHFVVNLVGLILLYFLHSEYSTPKMFTVNILILCLGISLCIYFWSPSIRWYVGLSGVLHGIFAWGVIIDIFFKRKTGYLLLAGLTVKIIDEQFFSDSQFMSNLIEAHVASDAHFFGAVIGIVIGIATITIFSESIPKTASLLIKKVAK